MIGKSEDGAGLGMDGWAADLASRAEPATDAAEAATKVIEVVAKNITVETEVFEYGLVKTMSIFSDKGGLSCFWNSLECLNSTREFLHS